VDTFVAHLVATAPVVLAELQQHRQCAEVMLEALPETAIAAYVRAGLDHRVGHPSGRAIICLTPETAVGGCKTGSHP